MEQPQRVFDAWSEVVGAYNMQGGKITGDFIPNNNFGR